MKLRPREHLTEREVERLLRPPSATGTASVTPQKINGDTGAATKIGPSDGDWAAPSLADGSHTIVASETDAAGDTGTTSLNFTLDNSRTTPLKRRTLLSPSARSA